MPHLHAIIYSLATGRVRRAVRADTPPADREKFAREAGIGAGEGVILVEGGDLHTWQAAVTATTGKSPTHEDHYEIVHAASGQVVNTTIADPACGDVIEGHILRPLKRP